MVSRASVVDRSMTSTLGSHKAVTPWPSVCHWERDLISSFRSTFTKKPTVVSGFGSTRKKRNKIGGSLQRDAGNDDVTIDFFDDPQCNLWSD
jgi:hypothetical protein